MAESLRRAAGSLLMVGLGGTEVTALERAWLRVVRPAGIILFRRNIADVGQTRELLAVATAECAAHCLRAVDVEGGTVDRLRDALAPMPSAQAVARADTAIPMSQMRDMGHPEILVGRTSQSPTLAQKTRKNGAPPSVAGTENAKARTTAGPSTTVAKATSAQDDRPNKFAREHGELVGQAVKAFGFNTTLAPVLDLGLPESAAVMGTRCAAADADGVVQYARGFLAGLAAQGVAGCGKHFPGLGAGMLDSHLETPKIGRAWKDLWSADLEPYRALRGELPLVMVSHAAYPETAEKKKPASVSRFWIETVLRNRIGYRGLVVSDDLEMGGILKYMSIEEAAVEAVRAGTELIEICHSPELILRAYEALVAEGERSKVFRDLILLHARESGRKRARLYEVPLSRALTERQFEALRGRVVKFGEQVEKAVR